MPSRSFTAAVGTSDSAGQIVVPFDPKSVFGKARAPVVVTIAGYEFRSTICAMGGPPFVPFRLSHREAAGVAPGDTVEVTLTLDEAPRTVEPPEALDAALTAAGLREAWRARTYTAQREDAEAVAQAKRDDTRQARISKILSTLDG